MKLLENKNTKPVEIKQIGLQMPAEMFMKLQERANEETISLSALIRRILKKNINQ